MRRYVAPLPTAYHLPTLDVDARARFPSTADVNVVTVDGAPNLAVYASEEAPFNGGAVGAWRTAVAAHVPPADRRTDTERLLEAIAAQAAGLAGIAGTPSAAQLRTVIRLLRNLARYAALGADGTVD